MMTKEGSTKIWNVMTLRAGGFVIGCGHTCINSLNIFFFTVGQYIYFKQYINIVIQNWKFMASMAKGLGFWIAIFLKIRKIYECYSNMPKPSCMCTVLLKLAKVERSKIRKFWVILLLITQRKAVIDCDIPHLDSVHDFDTCKFSTILRDRSNDDLYLLIYRCINTKHAKNLSILLESNGCWFRPLATPNLWNHISCIS